MGDEVTEHRLTIKIDRIDSPDSMQEAMQTTVLDVREMRGTPGVLAALLRRAADDLDPPPPPPPPRPTHRGGSVQGGTGTTT